MKSQALSTEVNQYLLVTGNYWAFTLTDGALRMLVVLHFHQLGFGALQIAMLFLFYEIFGVVTNLFGGYLGARIGLNRTMNIGLALQVFALTMLALPAHLLSMPWVMGAQALSGIAKDLNKMSVKSSIKALVAQGDDGKLFKWIAILTGSKNALKGVGFFLGGLLLSLVGFKSAVILMAVCLSTIWLSSLVLLKQDLGKSKNKPKFTEIFSKKRAVNILSAARLFLFGARDIWFVVALPVFLSSQLGWSFWWVGGFLASWVIGYGLVQSIAPGIIGDVTDKNLAKTTFYWTLALSLVTVAIASAFSLCNMSAAILIIGLLIFGIVFAINSSFHSFLIVRYAREDGTSLDVGFYYMANAMGRLAGTILSGWIYQTSGLPACLWAASVFIGVSALLAFWMDDKQ